MINCLIIDDETSAINVLKSYVEKTPFLNLIQTFTSPIEALTFLQSNTVDLIFLDIQMPELSGLDFMKALNDPKIHIILTTAYSEFAIEGFDLEALDYLLKPIPFDRFLRAANKSLKKRNAKPQEEASPEPDEQDYIFVKTESKGKYIKVDMKDTIFIESMKNYVSIYTQSQRIVTYASMKEMESILPEQFIRVHKSYIISMDYLEAIDGNQLFFQKMKYMVPIGEKYKKDFFVKLNHKTMEGKK